MPKGLLAVMVYSPVFFLLAYLIAREEEVGVLVMVMMSELLNSRPPLDQTAVGGGFPKILEAEIRMVSPALTETPSFMPGSIVMVGGSAEKTKERFQRSSSFFNQSIQIGFPPTIFILAGQKRCCL